MTLHIVSKPEAIEQCLNIANEQDALLFTEECYQITPALQALLEKSSQPVYWLSEDTVTGSQMASLPGIVVDYSGFVELCETYNPIQSWY